MQDQVDFLDKLYAPDRSMLQQLKDLRREHYDSSELPDPNHYVYRINLLNKNMGVDHNSIFQ